MVGIAPVLFHHEKLLFWHCFSVVAPCASTSFQSSLPTQLTPCSLITYTWAFPSNFFPPNFPVQILCGSSRFCSSSFHVVREGFLHGSREGRRELLPLCHQNCRQLTNDSPTQGGLDRRLPRKRRKSSFSTRLQGSWISKREEILPFHGRWMFVKHPGLKRAGMHGCCVWFSDHNMDFLQNS